MVEESTAASQVLASETGELSQLVSFFKVGSVQSAKSPARSTEAPRPASKPAARAVARQARAPASGGRLAKALAAVAQPDSEAQDWKEF
jgi:hypothetical protein